MSESITILLKAHRIDFCTNKKGDILTDVTSRKHEWVVNRMGALISTVTGVYSYRRARITVVRLFNNWQAMLHEDTCRCADITGVLTLWGPTCAATWTWYWQSLHSATAAL